MVILKPEDLPVTDDKYLSWAYQAAMDGDSKRLLPLPGDPVLVFRPKSYDPWFVGQLWDVKISGGTYKASWSEYRIHNPLSSQIVCGKIGTVGSQFAIEVLLRFKSQAKSSWSAINNGIADKVAWGETAVPKDRFTKHVNYQLFCAYQSHLYNYLKVQQGLKQVGLREFGTIKKPTPWPRHVTLD